MRALVLLWVGALLCACAGVPGKFTPRPAGMATQGAQVWPSAPETARYGYAGVLLGEANYPRDRTRRESTGSRVWRWLTGLERNAAPERALLRPQGGMVDAQGRLIIADVGKRALFVFDPRAPELAIWERADHGRTFRTPVALTQGPDAQLWVSDADLACIVRLDARGNPLGSFGRGVLLRPTGIVRDQKSGLTFVADSAAHDIKVFDAGHQWLRSLGRRGTGPGEFNGPTFLALDEDRLLVSDTLNARVQVLAADGTPMGHIGERGLYVGNLTRPKGVSVDARGHVYVVESYYDHLLVFDRTGRLLLPIGGTGAAPGKFFLPSAVWTDGADRVFVSDMFNGRVVLFDYLAGAP